MSEPRLVTRDFLLLTGGHFLQALGYATLVLLPLYLDHLHASRAEIGVIMALHAAGGLALRPVVAWALDTRGRRPTLLVGTLLLALSMGLIGLVTDTGPLIYFIRLLYGVGTGALFSGYFTFAADLVPASRRTEGLALFGLSGLAPLALNPVIPALGVDPPDLRWFFPCVGLFILASVALILPLKEPPRAPSTSPVTLRLAVRALVERPLWPVWLATLTFAGLAGIFMTFVTVTADKRGVANPASLWLAYAGGAAFIRLFGARLPDRLGPANLVAPALAFYVGGVITAAAAWSPAGFLLAGALAGVGHGTCFPILTSQAVTRTPAHLRGSAVTTFTALWVASELAFAPLFGAIADAGGDALMFASAGLAAALALALWSWLEHRHGPPPAAH